MRSDRWRVYRRLCYNPATLIGKAPSLCSRELVILMNFWKRWPRLRGANSNCSDSISGRRHIPYPALRVFDLADMLSDGSCRSPQPHITTTLKLLLVYHHDYILSPVVAVRLEPCRGILATHRYDLKVIPNMIFIYPLWFIFQFRSGITGSTHRYDLNVSPIYTHLFHMYLCYNQFFYQTDTAIYHCTCIKDSPNCQWHLTFNLLYLLHFITLISTHLVSP